MTPEEQAAAAAAQEQQRAAAKAQADALKAAADKAAADAAAKVQADAAAREAAAEAARKAKQQEADDDAADRNEDWWKTAPESLKEELKELRRIKAQKRDAAAEAEAAAAKKLADIEASLASERRAREVLAAGLQAREQDDALRAAYPKAEALNDPDVRALVRSTYADYAKTAGADAKPFDVWVREDAPKSTIVRLAIGATAATGGTGTRAGGRAPDVMRGTGGGGAAPVGTRTPEQIAAAASNPRTWRGGAGDEIRKQLEAELGPLGSGRPKAAKA